MTGCIVQWYDILRNVVLMIECLKNLNVSFFTVRVWRRESFHLSSMLSSKPPMGTRGSEQKLPLDGNHPGACIGECW